MEAEPGKGLNHRRGKVPSVEPEQDRGCDRLALNNPLTFEPPQGSQDSPLRCPRNRPLHLTAREGLVSARQDSEDIPVHGRGDDTEGMTQVHIQTRA